MTKSFLHLSTAVAMALSVALASCDNTANSTSAGTMTANARQDSSVTISNVPFDMNIKRAAQEYAMRYDGEDYGLRLDASVDWPTKIGDADITKLQSIIVAAISEDQTYSDIDSAMMAFVQNPEHYWDGDSIIVATRPLPKSERNYVASTHIKFTSLDYPLVTYSINYTTYTGGAHPQSVFSHFTFDLSSNRQIDLAMLFKDGYESVLMPILIDAFAEEADMTPRTLHSTMLPNVFPVSPIVSIRNGNIVFHYNQYDVLPYSYGRINVTIHPYLIKEILTPEAKALLNVTE